MKTSKLTTVFFDVDGTITSQPDSFWQMITTGLGASFEKHLRVLELAKHGQISNQQAVQSLVDLWRATGQASQDKLIQIAKTVEIYPQVFKFIDYLKSNNIESVLLSGTPDINIKQIQNRLKIDIAYTSTKFHFDEQGIINWFDYATDQAQAKLELFEGHLQKYSVDPKLCLMVGNGDNDLAVMQRVGLSAAPKIGSSKKVLSSVDYVYVDIMELVERLKMKNKK